MKKIICILLSFLMFTLASCGNKPADKKENTPQVEEKPKVDYVEHEFEYLQNSYAKITDEQFITIAFIGGSVTDGEGATNQQLNGWPRLICDRLSSDYGCFVSEKRKSLGGTGSFLANFRFGYEVAGGSNPTPDLLFIEFAVNDKYEGYTYDEVVRYSESLVRNAYKANENMDIVYVLSFDTATKTDDYTQLKAHRAVAEKYGLMCIEVSEYFYDYANPSVALCLADHVHPNDAGYRLYADCIYKAITSDFPTSGLAEPKIAKKTLPEAMSNYMQNPIMITADKIDLSTSTGWNYTASDFSWTGQRYKGYVYTEKKGSKLKFEFEGTDFGLFYNRSTDMGKVSVKIDGKTYTLDATDGPQNPKGKPIATNLKKGKHTVEITLLSGKMQIAGLLVN